jgi:hypothetical protein
VPFGYSHYCKCPVRVHIAQKLKEWTGWPVLKNGPGGLYPNREVSGRRRQIFSLHRKEKAWEEKNDPDLGFSLAHIKPWDSQFALNLVMLKP